MLPKHVLFYDRLTFSKILRGGLSKNLNNIICDIHFVSVLSFLLLIIYGGIQTHFLPPTLSIVEILSIWFHKDPSKTNSVVSHFAINMQHISILFTCNFIFPYIWILSYLIESIDSFEMKENIPMSLLPSQIPVLLTFAHIYRLV